MQWKHLVYLEQCIPCAKGGGGSHPLFRQSKAFAENCKITTLGIPASTLFLQFSMG